MKLRNKKTGEINKRIDVSQDGVGIWVFCSKPQFYKSLSEINEDWEDYTPKEPIIKDEKIRKAVRAWADANEIETVKYDDYWVAFRRDDKVISFKDEDSCLGFCGLDDDNTYIIDELCGDEDNA